MVRAGRRREDTDDHENAVTSAEMRARLAMRSFRGGYHRRDVMLSRCRELIDTVRGLARH